MSDLLTLADVEEAAERIRDTVRRTPLIEVGPVKSRLVTQDATLHLKLECLQVTGSFKPRGASNKLALTDKQIVARGVCTASGGNHGLAVAYVARHAHLPATIFVPSSTPQHKCDKIEAWDAEVVVHGEVWDEANDAAHKTAMARGLVYVHPFADPAVIAGQGTVALEVLADVPDIDTLLVAIGGGGLISGIATAAQALRPSIKIVGVEPTGAPTMFESIKARQLVTLGRIDTTAGTLAPRRTTARNLQIITDTVDRIVLVSDDEMRQAARWLWFELGIAAELSGAATVAALMFGRHRPQAGENVVSLICGAGTDGLG